nr:MAG TPA: hypothetical protein [Caudoviricetes sp.]DAY30333.1 MAG TPA: hypothetical protein [Inoviridae sp.]
MAQVALNIETLIVVSQGGGRNGKGNHCSQNFFHVAFSS